MAWQCQHLMRMNETWQSARCQVRAGCCLHVGQPAVSSRPAAAIRDVGLVAEKLSFIPTDSGRQIATRSGPSHTLGSPTTETAPGRESHSAVANVSTRISLHPEINS